MWSCCLISSGQMIRVSDGDDCDSLTNSFSITSFDTFVDVVPMVVAIVTPVGAMNWTADLRRRRAISCYNGHYFINAQKIIQRESTIVAAVVSNRCAIGVGMNWIWLVVKHI